ncbi:MAG: MBL fold metallo-hydrolase [Maribacter sp.]|nr:MBL fold metallo-hydrolase [Maribacter sp.]
MKHLLIVFLCSGLLTVACKNKQNAQPHLDAPMQDMAGETAPPPPPMAIEETNNEVKIIAIEHATALLEWNGLTIYVDPVGGAKAFEGQKDPDLILITDIHGDHLSLETLQELNAKNAKIMAPKEVADKLPAEFISQVDVMNNGDTKKEDGITIEAIPMYNLREEAKNFHTKGRGNGYLLTMGGERIYFSGDTEDIPEMRDLKNIDKAFVCMNLPYTMTVEKAAEAVLAFKPKQVYPYHYRGNPDVSDVSKFKKLVNAGNPDIEVVQLDWYPKEAY